MQEKLEHQEQDLARAKLKHQLELKVCTSPHPSILAITYRGKNDNIVVAGRNGNIILACGRDNLSWPEEVTILSLPIKMTLLSWPANVTMLSGS